MDIVTKATAYLSSSVRDKEILYFFLLIFFSTFILVLSINLIKGFPFFSFITIISLNLIPLAKPVPKALAKASLAANLLA